MPSLLPTAAALLSLAALARAQSCSNDKEVDYQAPVLADGWSYRLVADGLRRPRSIAFDDDGHLLVVDSGVGIVRMRLKDDGGTCVSVDEQDTIVEDDDLNHGLAVSSNGEYLYASTAENVYRWSYSSSSSPGDRLTLVTNMTNGGHTTRTILLPPSSPDLLLVSRGSDGNNDEGTREIDSGRSQLRIFNISSADSDDFDAIDYINGEVLAWGLRNSVGVAEHPEGGIWTVENSVDNLDRDGEDIHRNNPGEELNYHGVLNGSDGNERGANYGYPDCVALWNTDGFPNRGDLEIGDQFAHGDGDGDVDDEECNEDFIAPRLTFQAHTAPLDIKFSRNGSEAFVTLHGSWNREDPVGYKIVSIPFANGQPIAGSSSTTAAEAIISNEDLSQCPDDCFRPVGMAWDGEGRLFFTSDSTGEIFVLQRDNGSGGDGGSEDGGSEDSESGGSSGGDGSSGNDDEGGDEDGVLGLYQVAPRSAAWAVTFAAVVVGMLLT